MPPFTAQGTIVRTLLALVALFVTWGDFMLPYSCDSDWLPAGGFGKSVIIIGNGPSITDEPMGDWIDSFDEVVRFNNFKLIPK